MATQCFALAMAESSHATFRPSSKSPLADETEALKVAFFQQDVTIQFSDENSELSTLLI